VTRAANSLPSSREPEVLLLHFTEAGTRRTALLAPSAGEFPHQRRETTMVSSRINSRMGVIFDEIEIEEVIAPRL
jgi:hypothetical protein